MCVSPPSLGTNAYTHQLGELKMTDHIAYVIIPALPGFEAVQYYHNNGGADACIDRQPVVAWRIDPAEGSEWAEAITPDLLNRDIETYIKYPDGRIVWPAVQTWDDEAAWLVDTAVRGEEKRKAA